MYKLQLKTLRKRANLSQNAFAEAMNISQQSVSKYENGERFPDISLLVQMADFFQVSLDELVNHVPLEKDTNSFLQINNLNDENQQKIKDYYRLLSFAENKGMFHSPK